MTILTPLFVVRFALTASLTALIAAYLSQYIGGLQPCPLCLYQRVPYGINIFLGAVAIYLIGRDRMPIILIAVIGSVFMVDAGIAFYHVGVEQGWFEGLAACAGGGETPGTVSELMSILLNEPPPPPCDQVQWSLFGVSMAGYNMVYASLSATITLIGVVKWNKARPR